MDKTRTTDKQNAQHKTNFLTVQTARSFKDTEAHEVNKDTAHHRAQFISMHLNILFIVQRSCNLVVPWQLAGGLGLHSDDGSAREQSHTAKCSHFRNHAFANSNSNFPAVFLCMMPPGSSYCEILLTQVVSFCGIFIYIDKCFRSHSME